MDGTMKIFEDNHSNIYNVTNDDVTYFMAIPKFLSNNIEFYIELNNGITRDNVNSEFQDINKVTNVANKIVIIFYGLNITQGNSFIEQENKVKKVINVVYNFLLRANFKKEDFTKVIKIVSKDASYEGFSDWLTSQNPNKFSYAVNAPSITQDGNINFTSDKEQFFNDTDNGGGPVNSGEYSNNQEVSKVKTLVKTPPKFHGSAAFVKWYNILFILLVSLVIGIVSAILILK